MAKKMTKYEAEKLFGFDAVASYTYADMNKMYRSLVRKNHPDLGGDPEMMVEINLARDKLNKLFDNDKNAVIVPEKQYGASVGGAEPADDWQAEWKAREKAAADEREKADAAYKARREQWKRENEAKSAADAAEADAYAAEHGYVWNESTHQWEKNAERKAAEEAEEAAWKAKAEAAYKAAYEQAKRDRAEKEAKPREPEHFDWGEDIYAEKEAEKIDPENEARKVAWDKTMAVLDKLPLRPLIVIIGVVMFAMAAMGDDFGFSLIAGLMLLVSGVELLSGLVSAIIKAIIASIAQFFVSH